MTFREFLASLYYCFTSTVGYIENVIETILNTHFGKLAIYFLIFSIIIFLGFQVWNLLISVVDNSVNEMQDIIIKEKKEKKNSNTNGNEYQPRHAQGQYYPRHGENQYSPRHGK